VTTARIREARIIEVLDAGATTILITDLSVSAKARASSDVLR